MAADLIHILPAWFRPVREFQVIMEAHGAALDQAEKQIRQTWDNCFIQTADADTIRMYEELFGLVYKPGETLEFRRQRILQMYNIIPPFSIGFFHSRLRELFGNDCSLEVDPVRSTIRVIVTSSQYGAVDLLYGLVWDIVPAHMEVTANHQVTNDMDGKLCMAGFVAGTVVQTI